MKTLIIYAHPDTEGHCSAILKEVQNRLISKEIEYETLDLYKMNYDPILHESEHYTAGNRDITEQNKEIQEKIKNTNKLIFIYPVWWGGMPAILKGFFDRVLTPEFAYKFEKGIPRRLLKGKKAVVFTTSGGPKIFHTITGDTSKKTIKNKILEFCGIKTKVFLIDTARKITDNQLEKIKTKVKEGLNYIYS